MAYGFIAYWTMGHGLWSIGRLNDPYSNRTVTLLPANGYLGIGHYGANNGHFLVQNKPANWSV